MFWVQRLRNEDEDASWLVAYGDLMSLLLAVFVMIAAMSELRPGRHYAVVRDGVRKAFGFSIGGHDASVLLGTQRPMTLVDRLERAGLRPTTEHAASQDDESALAPCDVLVEKDRVVIRVAGAACFEAFSARLQPAGRQAIERIADYLADGQAGLEIRGHAGDGSWPVSAPFRDALDLSYERARAVAAVLREKRVAGERLQITSRGDHDPLIRDPGPVSGGVNRRVEIILYASPMKGSEGNIAEKERVKHG